MDTYVLDHVMRMQLPHYCTFHLKRYIFEGMVSKKHWALADNYTTEVLLNKFPDLMMEIWDIRHLKTKTEG